MSTQNTKVVPDIFRPNPKITEEDRESLTPLLANASTLRPLLKTQSAVQVWMKCVIIELERAEPRMSILLKLVYGLVKAERRLIERRVTEAVLKK